jgi:hypothetical protein
MSDKTDSTSSHCGRMGRELGQGFLVFAIQDAAPPCSRSFSAMVSIAMNTSGRSGG